MPEQTSHNPSPGGRSRRASRLRFALALLGLLAAVGLPARAVEPVVLEGNQSWSGVQEISQVLRIPAGSELVVQSGAELRFRAGASLQVQGALRVQGSAEAPARLVGAPESGTPLLEISGPGAVARLEHAVVVSAAVGAVVRGARLEARKVDFKGNEKALLLELKGQAELRDSVFAGNGLALSVGNGSRCDAAGLEFRGNRVGLGINNSSALRLANSGFTDNQVGYAQQNACDSELRECRFEGNRTGLGLRQTRRSPRVYRCRFTDNRRAVDAQLFSHVLVEASTFRGNELAFNAEQFCGVYLRYNAFEDNLQAIRLDHKANARLEHNRIQDNGIALFADYSSYPHIRANLFAGNAWHVRLGIFQSADWEQRRGSRGLMMGAAQRAGTRNPMLLAGEVPEGAGVFTVTGNAWGPETAAELAAGGAVNVSRFWDGRDQPTVTYPGFGEGEFEIDVIQVGDALAPADVAVGPAAWRPLEDASETAPAGAPESESPGG